MFNYRFAFSTPDPTHQQDSPCDACAPQLDAFIGRCDSEPRGTSSFQRTRALDGAVSIGIALHNGADRRVGSNDIANQLVVIDESWERDLGPCGSRRHELSLASGLF